CLGARAERHGIDDDARGRASAVPTDERALAREGPLLDVRHDDDGTPGFEQRAFDDEFVGRSLLALRLTDNGDVEAPRDLGEQRGGAAERGIELARFRCNPAFLHSGFESADGVTGNLAVFLALQLDQVDRYAAERAVGNYWLVQEGNTGDVRAKGRGDRDRIIGREIQRGPARQIDDDILQHARSPRDWRGGGGPSAAAQLA